MFRRRRPPEQPHPLDAVDPAAVPSRYRLAVSDALASRRRFGDLTNTLRPGPLRDRLSELQPRVDAGVLAVWQTTVQATELERVVATLDPDRVTDELKQARRQGADHEAVETLAARFASTQRLLNALDQLRQQLPLVGARLDTAVARAAELALTSPLGDGGTDVQQLRDDLEALVLDLDAVGQAAGELA